MISPPLFWGAFNWSADFLYDLPPRRSLLAAFPCGFPPSVRQLSVATAFSAVHVALIYGSNLLSKIALSPLYFIASLLRLIAFAFLAGSPRSCYFRTPRIRIGRKSVRQCAAHMWSSFCLPMTLPNAIDETDETEPDECHYAARQLGCRPDPLDYVITLCATLFSGIKVCLQACLALTSWIVACAARIALAWTPTFIIGQSALCLMKLMICIFIISFRALFMKNYLYEPTRSSRGSLGGGGAQIKPTITPPPRG